jgi:hypothetical protein
MTRLPLESRAVRGVDGEPYELNLICAKPDCLEVSTDPHHLWRRSELIGPYWYVHIEDDDLIVGNVVGLCSNHHHAITVNAAWIEWQEGRYRWNDMLTSDEPLSFQPPVRPVEDALTPITQESVTQESVDGTCPTCLRPLPHPKREHEPKRMRRTWSITVPVDERENGAETLTTLLEEGRREMARAGLPYGTEETANFFVLSAMMGLFVAHAEEFLG